MTHIIYTKFQFKNFKRPLQTQAEMAIYIKIGIKNLTDWSHIVQDMAQGWNVANEVLDLQVQ